MKKRIRLTEGQLHKLIEQAINEISTQTKMSAANKAQREGNKYWKKYKNPDDPDPEHTRKMLQKRFRQKNAFTNAVNKAMDDPIFDSGAAFHPGKDETGYDNRGSMNINPQPVNFSCYGKNDVPYHTISRFKDVEQYLNGNSYYDKERGKWLNPDDEGYDKEKSEPWAMIRRNNESLARRVTESIIRRLNESSTTKQKQGVRFIENTLGIPFGGNIFNGREVAEFLGQYLDYAYDVAIDKLKTKQETNRNYKRESLY